MNVVIRKAVMSDFGELLRLNKALFDFEAKYNHDYNLDWTYADVGQNYFKKRLESEDSLLFIAEIEGEAIGYILGFIGTYFNRSVNPICEVENMFVEEGFRRKGVGGMLMDTVRKGAKEKDVKKLKVGAIAQNENAIKFYRSQGFDDVNLYLEETLQK